MRNSIASGLLLFIVFLLVQLPAQAQIGRRFPSEKRIVKDPVTGVKLTFLTSTPAGDGKIYQTHNQWTSDGKWVIFRSDRARGEVLAVNEKTGEIIQVSEGGYTGMLNVARQSMKLYFMRPCKGEQSRSSVEIIEVDLAKLFADSKSGKLQNKTAYERICGTTPPAWEAGGDMALDGDEEWVWFRVGKTEAGKRLPEGTKIEENFGPRKMGAGPAGIAGMNVRSGELKYVVSVPFQVGHIQNNPWKPGQIFFCWETGGKAPQRTWTVNADGTGLSPVYRESPEEWITHEAVISRDEMAFTINGSRRFPESGQPSDWGPSGTRQKPSGLGIINLTTKEMYIAGQPPLGSGFWHVNGTSDGRFAAGDDFDRNIYLINRKSGEMILLSAGHKATAADHPHPTFSPDGTRIEIQSAMLSADDRSMNICIIPVPKKWLKNK